MWKKLAAMSIGTIGGVVLVVAVWRVWDVVHPPPHLLDAAERSQLRQKLDESPNAIVMFDEATSYRYKPNFHGYRSRPTHLGSRNRMDFPHLTNSLGLVGTEEISADQRPKVLFAARRFGHLRHVGRCQRHLCRADAEASRIELPAVHRRV